MTIEYKIVNSHITNNSKMNLDIRLTSYNQKRSNLKKQQTDQTNNVNHVDQEKIRGGTAPKMLFCL